jgi:resuscitation-promoting factor RpfA
MVFWRAMPTVAALTGAAYVLIHLGPSTLAEAQSAATSEALVTAGCELVGLTVLAWVAGGTVLSLGAALPGWLGRGADALARRWAPVLVRTAVRASLGLGLAAATSVPALAASAPSPAPQWPSLDRAPVPAVAPAHHTQPYVVRPGDTLWEIAARHLGGHPTAADIAKAWPAWWAANRNVVGDNPNLIHPGQRLGSPGEPPA